MGGIFVIAGVWLRTLIVDQSIFWCLAGTTLCSIGCMFILSSPSIMGTNWFKPASMPVIIFSAVTINLISGATGSALPGLMVKEVEGDK